MPTISDTPSTAWGACARIVEAATKSCAAPPRVLPPARGEAPDWDAMANSFASLSVALTVGSIVLALLAFLTGFAWMRIVSDRAAREAKTIAEQEAKRVAGEAQKEAKSVADAYIAKWLIDEAPNIIRAHVENLQNATLGAGNDEDAADEMGKAAG